MLIETTKFFDWRAAVHPFLDDMYDFDDVREELLRFSPTDIGIPTERCRLHLPLIKLDGKLERRAPITRTHMMRLFGAPPLVGGEIFFEFQNRELAGAVVHMKRKLAQQARLDPDEVGVDTSVAAMLSHGVRERIAEHMALAEVIRIPPYVLRKS